MNLCKKKIPTRGDTLGTLVNHTLCSRVPEIVCVNPLRRWLLGVGLAGASYSIRTLPPDFAACLSSNFILEGLRRNSRTHIVITTLEPALPTQFPNTADHDRDRKSSLLAPDSFAPQNLHHLVSHHGRCALLRIIVEITRPTRSASIVLLRFERHRCSRHFYLPVT